MQCRICLESDGVLYRRCMCGEAAWFHDRCLVGWMRASSSSACEICGQPYTGVSCEKHTTYISPDAVFGAAADVGANTFVIGGLWWYGHCGVLGAIILYWWAMCWTAERAIRRRRLGGDVWALQTRKYRLARTEATAEA